LEKGMGATVFRDRALALAPQLATDRYLEGSAEQLLLELYQARSDCVHGKVPFLDLRAQGEEGLDRAAQLAYVADVLAREALLAALKFRDRSIFASRAALEGAWQRQAFPSVRA
jgi:hypothetical protein